MFAGGVALSLIVLTSSHGSSDTTCGKTATAEVCVTETVRGSSESTILVEEAVALGIAVSGAACMLATRRIDRRRAINIEVQSELEKDYMTQFGVLLGDNEDTLPPPYQDIVDKESETE